MRFYTLLLILQESGDARMREIERRQSAKPNRTLFVVNFEPASTFMDDLRAFFEQWGALERVQLKTKFAFVEVRYWRYILWQRCMPNTSAFVCSKFYAVMGQPMHKQSSNMRACFMTS